MRTVLGILVFLPMLCMAQENLVPNPSFEEHSDCPNGMNDWNKVVDWVNANGSSPDYFHVCGPPQIIPPDTFPMMGVPTNIFGYQMALDGAAYMGFYGVQLGNQEWREYVQTELIEPIQPGIRYSVSFYVSLSENSRYGMATLGAYLSENAIGSNDLLALDADPQLLHDPLQPILDTAEWVLITDTFASRSGGGERFITIGNFFSDAESDTVFFNPEPPLGNRHAYYYIDDVSVIALDSVPSSVAEHERDRENFLVYPNPSNGQFTLSYQLDEFEVGSVKVFDVTGRQVFAQPLKSKEGTTEIVLSGLNSGIYVLKVDVNNEIRFRERMIISRE